MEILDPRPVVNNVVNRSAQAIDGRVGGKQLAAVDRIGAGT